MASETPISPANLTLPRITIKFCTQCRWMLRAAYFAQELLSTFGPAIGEIALQPTTGGVFRVDLTYVPPLPANTATQEKSNGEGVGVQEVLLWDRKAEGGFPETKVLKQRVRDRLEPERDLGHSDVGGKKAVVMEGDKAGLEGVVVEKGSGEGKADKNAKDCEDCK